MLAKQFRKDYFPYFIGIIIPAAAGFLTIPILKNLLGAEKYGIYTFYLSMLLIINSSFSGGISQSIIRLQIDNENKNKFYLNFLYITLLLSVIIALPVFIYLRITNPYFIFSIFFIASLCLSNFYTSLLAVTQSRLQSATSAISESLRTILFIAIAILLLWIYGSEHFLQLLFIALIGTYIIVCLFLFFKNKSSIVPLKTDVDSIKNIASQFSTYGGYLTLWFFFCYGISLANRFVLAQFFGKESIGHFTASFDILNKSIVFILSPVLIALFPLVVKAHSEGHYKQVRSLIRKLLLIEGLLMIFFLCLYPIIGFPILTRLLNSPGSSEYLWLDMQVIAGTFIWQLAMLQHKFLELNKRTHRMLLFVIISFCLSLTIDFICISTAGIKFAGIGFLSGALCYFLLVGYYSRQFLHKLY